jgi:hypothetical protein
MGDPRNFDHPFGEQFIHYTFYSGGAPIVTRARQFPGNRVVYTLAQV